MCPIFKTRDTKFYPDLYADRETKKLLVICENKENGCSWSGKLEKLEV